MKTFSVLIEGKRPAYATDEVALQRHTVDGMSVAQIAREWNISPSMVSRMVRRARLKANNGPVIASGPLDGQ